MAAPVIDVFLNQTMVAFLDKDRTVPYCGKLYQHTDRYFVDEGLMVAANRHLADCTCTDTCDVKPVTTQRVNEGFTKKQTLFLIHLMRIHIQVEGPAKSLMDLNRRLKLRKKTKKLLWEEMAGKLARQFGEHFQHDKVARKWSTLVEGYKKVKDNNTLTGRGPVRFQFYTEMDELLGDNHDVDPPVVGGDCVGVVIRLPDSLRRSCQQTELPHLCLPPAQHCQRCPPAPCPRLPSLTQLPPVRVPTPPPEDELLAYLQMSDAAAQAASQRRHEEIMAEMRSLRNDRRELLQLFSRMVDKM